jgi:hypothetical protein
MYRLAVMPGAGHVSPDEGIGASLCQPVPSACKRFTANEIRVSSQQVNGEEIGKYDQLQFTVDSSILTENSRDHLVLKLNSSD